jgi:hypothetical protein
MATTYTTEQAKAAFEMTNGATKTYEATFMVKELSADVKEKIKAEVTAEIERLIIWYKNQNNEEGYTKYFTNKEEHIIRKTREAESSYIYSIDETVRFVANDKSEAEKLARIQAKTIGKKLRWVYLAQKVGA